MSRKPRRMKTFFAGLDITLRYPAVTVVDERGEYIAHLGLRPRITGTARIAQTYERLNEFLLPLASRLVCGVEDHAYGVRVGQTFSMGEVAGVVKLMLYRLGIPFKAYSPQRAKQVLTGSGRASKEAMEAGFIKYIGGANPLEELLADKSAEHLIDAFAIAELARHEWYTLQERQPPAAKAGAIYAVEREMQKPKKKKGEWSRAWQ